MHIRLSQDKAERRSPSSSLGRLERIQLLGDDFLAAVALDVGCHASFPRSPSQRRFGKRLAELPCSQILYVGTTRAGLRYGMTSAPVVGASVFSHKHTGSAGFDRSTR
jgi:hypothetical protein